MSSSFALTVISNVHLAIRVWNKTTGNCESKHLQYFKNCQPSFLLSQALQENLYLQRRPGRYLRLFYSVCNRTCFIVRSCPQLTNAALFHAMPDPGSGSSQRLWSSCPPTLMAFSTSWPHFSSTPSLNRAQHKRWGRTEPKGKIQFLRKLRKNPGGLLVLFLFFFSPPLQLLPKGR